MQLLAAWTSRINENKAKRRVKLFSVKYICFINWKRKIRDQAVFDQNHRKFVWWSSRSLQFSTTLAQSTKLDIEWLLTADYTHKILSPLLAQLVTSNQEANMSIGIQKWNKFIDSFRQRCSKKVVIAKQTWPRTLNGSRICEKSLPVYTRHS